MPQVFCTFRLIDTLIALTVPLIIALMITANTYPKSIPGAPPRHPSSSPFVERTVLPEDGPIPADRCIPIDERMR